MKLSAAAALVATLGISAVACSETAPSAEDMQSPSVSVEGEPQLDARYRGSVTVRPKDEVTRSARLTVEYPSNQLRPSWVVFSRWTGSEWEAPVPVEDGEVVPDDQFGAVAERRFKRITVTVPADLEPGQYKICSDLGEAEACGLIRVV